MARCPSSCDAISTKPKPRERPVSRSVTTEADCTSPTWPNSSCKSSLEVLKLRLPTKSLMVITDKILARVGALREARMRWASADGGSEVADSDTGGRAASTVEHSNLLSNYPDAAAHTALSRGASPLMRERGN